MRGTARVDVIGHLGTDAEQTYTTGGTARLKFSIAVNVWVQQGQPERTNWYRCTWFGTRAEKVAEYLKKGTPVHIRGDLDAREWESDGGKRGTSLDVTVSELDLLGSKPQAVAPAGGQAESDADLPF